MKLNRFSLIATVLMWMFAFPIFASQKSEGGKPRWLTSELPEPVSPGYIFIKAQGTGKSLEEARQRLIVNLVSQLEHEHGWTVDVGVKATETIGRKGKTSTNQEFTLECTEKGKQINATGRIIDEYWERSDYGIYTVTDLFTINDNKQPGKGSYSDNIYLTTSYGAAPVLGSLIPGVGQFMKGSNLKGGLILGGTAIGAAATIFTESQRAEYAKKMKEHPEHIDFYRNKKSNWGIGRNVAIGATAALYIYNLIDAAVAPGRRKVVVGKNKYQYALYPAVVDDFTGTSFGVSFAMNF